MKTLFLFLASLPLSLPLAAQGTAAFPGAVTTFQQVYAASDNAQTTLSAPLDNVSLLVSVASTSGFQVPTLLTIDSEQLLACTKTSTTFAICSGGRGAAGTLATAHLSTAKVAVRIAAAFHNNVAQEVMAIEKKLNVEQPTLKDAGCKGDNATDDTACAQAAITASIAAKTPLYCTAGTYKITSTLVATLIGTTSSPSNWAFKGDGACVLESWSSDGSGVLRVTNSPGVPFSDDATEISGIVFRRHQGGGVTGQAAFALKLDALVGAKVLRNKFLSDPFHPELAFSTGLDLNGMQQGEVAGNRFVGNTVNVWQRVGSGTPYDNNGGPSDFHGNTIFNGQVCYLITGGNGMDTWITDDHLGVCPVGIHNASGNVKVNGVHFEQHATAGFLQDGGGGRSTIMASSFYDTAPANEISIQSGDSAIIGNPIINANVVFGANACNDGAIGNQLTGCSFIANHYNTKPVDSSGRVFFMANTLAGVSSYITATIPFNQPIRIDQPFGAGSLIPLLVLQGNVNIGEDVFSKSNATGAAGVSAHILNGSIGICNDTTASFFDIASGLGLVSGSCGTRWARFLSDRTLVPRVVSTGATPICGAGSGGGGAGFLCSVSGTDSIGTVTVTVGSGPAGAPLITLTAGFTAPSLYHMVLTPANAATAALGANAAYVAGNSANAVTLYTPSSLTAGTTYSWQYNAGGR